MIIKIDRDVENKLSYISQSSKIKKDILIKKIFDAFIERFEASKGVIPPKEKKRGNELYVMLQVYKKHYFINFAQEYNPDKKQELRDFKTLKNIKEKLMSLIMGVEKTDIIAIDEEELVNCFEYFLVKMPDWWKQNMFVLTGLNKNFEKILIQINNGKHSGKAALDDFVAGFANC